MSELEGAVKQVEYQVNKEERLEIDESDPISNWVDGDFVKDIVDVDHRDTLEEAKEHFFLQEGHWSIEKVERWAVNGDEVKREHTLVEESGGDSQ